MPIIPRQPGRNRPQKQAARSLRGLDMLSLFQRLRERAEESTHALPALMAAAERATASLMGGEHRQRRAGSGENFWQFREYDPTDRPQDIDWRQTAKGERVYVRQKEWQTTQTVLFWCQNDAGMHYRSSDALPSKYESAVILTLGLGLLLIRGGEQIGLLDGSVRPMRGDGGVQNLGLALLSEKKRGADSAMPPPPPMQTHHFSVVLCGDFLGPPEDLDKSLAIIAAQSHHGVLIQTFDTAERVLPWGGRVIFTGMAGAAREAIDNVDSIRDQYRARLDAHIESVRRVAQRYGFDHILHDTSTASADALGAAWASLSPHRDTERMA